MLASCKGHYAIILFMGYHLDNNFRNSNVEVCQYPFANTAALPYRALLDSNEQAVLD